MVCPPEVSPAFCLMFPTSAAGASVAHLTSKFQRSPFAATLLRSSSPLSRSAPLVRLLPRRPDPCGVLPQRSGRRSKPATTWSQRIPASPHCVLPLERTRAGRRRPRALLGTHLPVDARARPAHIETERADPCHACKRFMPPRARPPRPWILFPRHLLYSAFTYALFV